MLGCAYATAHPTAHASPHPSADRHPSTNPEAAPDAYPGAGSDFLPRADPGRNDTSYRCLKGSRLKSSARWG
jgi:hypothetical protein